MVGFLRRTGKDVGAAGLGLVLAGTSVASISGVNIFDRQGLAIGAPIPSDAMAQKV
jgi:hypothetical protein